MQVTDLKEELSSLTIHGNGGADDFGLTDLTGLRSLSFSGGAGDDFLLATNLAVKGDASVDLGADGGLVAFAGSATSISGDFRATYGGGGSVDFFADRTTIRGSVKLIGGSAGDAFSFGNVVSVDRGIEISDTGGGMSVSFQDATAVIGSGRGHDAIEFVGGMGVDSLAFKGGHTVLRGDLEFKGGAGADTVNLDTDSLRVDGKVELAGGGGDDSLNLFSEALSVAGSVAILGGDGANVSSFFADGSVRGDVRIDMGGADGGDQTFLLGGLSGEVGALRIGGSLLVKSDAADPGNAGFSDFFSGTDLVVGRDVRIGMGAVDSFVLLDNLFVRGEVRIDTGAGDDTVEIEQGGLSGPSIIGRLAAIQLGAGDDVLRIGKSSATGSNDSVVFKGGVSADGGPGNDASNDFLSDAVNVFGQSPRGHDRFDSPQGSDDDDDDDRGRFDGGRGRLVKERLNFESFLA